MTDTERSIHAQVTHLDPQQRDALLKIAAGKRVTKQTISSFAARGWVTHDDYTNLALTDDGHLAVRIINQEFR